MKTLEEKMDEKVIELSRENEELKKKIEELVKKKEEPKITNFSEEQIRGVLEKLLREHKHVNTGEPDWTYYPKRGTYYPYYPYYPEVGDWPEAPQIGDVPPGHPWWVYPYYPYYPYSPYYQYYNTLTSSKTVGGSGSKTYTVFNTEEKGKD